MLHGAAHMPALFAAMIRRLFDAASCMPQRADMHGAMSRHDIAPGDAARAMLRARRVMRLCAPRAA
jgi:hypothetical protein